MFGAFQERLRDILGMNVMDRLHSEIRKYDLVPARQIGKDAGIEIGRRI
jgi:hypothetical protein